MIDALESDIFNLAPIAMWIEDFSRVQALFDDWRSKGVTDIKAFLREDRSRIHDCSTRIRVIAVNAKTLDLFEADNLEHLVANITAVFRDDMLDTHINELSALFDGEMSFSSTTVNYTISGRRLDIQLRGTVLPGHEETLGRVLLTTEDITDREDARRAEAEQRRQAEGIFQHSPVSLWIEDFSRIRTLIEDIRERGITDFRTFMDVHPEFVRQCMSEIRVIDVNARSIRCKRSKRSSAPAWRNFP